MLCRAVCAAAAGLLPLPAAGAASDARKLPPRPGDALALSSWASPGGALETGDVVSGAPPLLVFPRDPASGVARARSRLNQILLVRLAPGSLAADAREISADGVLAYSGICTHAACGVSAWDAAQAALVCPGHASHFAAAERGRVLSGPATRGLPLLPLTLPGASAGGRTVHWHGRRRAAMSSRTACRASLLLGLVWLLNATVIGAERSYAPVTAARRAAPAAGDWLQYRRTYDSWGYSPLAAITPANVASLRPVWTLLTGIEEAHQAPPIVNDGVMIQIAPLGPGAGDGRWTGLRRRHQRSLLPRVRCAQRRDPLAAAHQLGRGRRTGQL